MVDALYMFPYSTPIATQEMEIIKYLSIRMKDTRIKKNKQLVQPHMAGKEI